MEEVLLDGAGTACAVRLLLLTSGWSGAADAVVRARVDALPGSVGDVMQRVELRRASGDVQEPTCSSSGGWMTKTVDADRFGRSCKRLGVVELPAIALVDQSGSLINAERIESLVRELKPAKSHDDNRLDAALRGLLRLDEDAHAPAIEVPWWTSMATAETNRETQEIVCRESSDPEVVQMREQAAALFEGGELLAAAARFMQVLVQCPRCTKSNFNLAVILHMLGETYFATTFMLRVVMIDDSDSVAHTVLRTVYYSEEPERVMAGYRAAIAASPRDHVRAVHSLATLEGDAVTAAPQYVREVFDELADTFEEKLVTHLEYRVPWQLVDALKRLEPEKLAESATPKWIVADVGCGTGLCGRLLRPHAKRMIGVDISPQMIDKTRASGFYDDLHTTDIAPFLASCTDASLDLVISGDVWIYVGALDEVFALCARKLKPATGQMAFSIELLDQSGASFRLARSGRFQHSHDYIADLTRANGFDIALSEDIDVRKESGQPIPGRIYVLKCAASRSS